MILAGSFAEVDIIYDRIMAMGHEINVIKATSKKRMEHTIEEFTKKGGLLIATRNYGTGVSLGGEALEELYIVKLPFPILGSNRWIGIRKDEENMFWHLVNSEMIMTLRQYLGRLQRRKEDKGDIHILTSQVLSLKVSLLSDEMPLVY